MIGVLFLVYTYLVGQVMYLSLWTYMNDGRPPEQREIVLLVLQMIFWPVTFVYLAFKKEKDDE